MNDFKSKIENLREDFNKYKIDIKNLPKHPVSMFSNWIKQALENNDQANAFVLSTVSNKNIPSSRVVLLRGFDENGFTFFTNYQSKKSIDIEKNNTVALNFHWPESQRQVRIIGKAEKISAANSDKYFNSRPRESQIGAWVSEQSTVVSLYFKFVNAMDEIESKFKGKKVERPKHWGGYKIMPSSIEFWQGRPFRLHQRIKYSLHKNNWKIERLSP
ncbi:MAG: pyridoxamine 5'-phosphate oxidase [Flavobacteriales bacterium]|nr:pyridoxamine 5'-phosphate oxidase [Flavobacteriales bacterium]